MKAQQAFENFRSELNRLCERGTISRETKNVFSHIRFDGAGELAYGACNALYEFFKNACRDSAEYSAAATQVAELVGALFGDGSGLEKDCAVVCAYIYVTREANASGDEKHFKTLRDHAADYNKSLESLRYGLPLFS